MSTLLQLPRELRNLIYDCYFAGDGDYTHNFETNKLSRADNQPIELALVLSCRQIANETRGLALRINTLRFTTFHSDATQEDASVLHASNNAIRYIKESILNYATHDYLSEEQAQTAREAYPQFTPVIDHWQSPRHSIIYRALFRPYLICGEAPSIWHDFVAFTLDLVSQHPEFLKNARVWSELPFKNNEYHLISDVDTKPWEIPDGTEIARLRNISGQPFNTFHLSARTKHAYSAASRALLFLHSASEITRENIRKILLIENRESISLPESHGRGFIPFCQRYPQLKVERRASLWSNVFPTASHKLEDYLGNDQSLMDEDDEGTMIFDRCFARDMTKAVGTWMKEARALIPLGMPHDSFTLVLDGELVPELSSRAFRVIQRDVAWQTALDTCYARGILSQPSWLDRRLGTSGFIYEGLPEAVRALSTNSPLIRTNFELPPPDNVEQLLDENKGWSAHHWDIGWDSHKPEFFQTEPPLPPWHVLRWGHVIWRP